MRPSFLHTAEVIRYDVSLEYSVVACNSLVCCPHSTLPSASPHGIDGSSSYSIRAEVKWQSSMLRRCPLCQHTTPEGPLTLDSAQSHLPGDLQGAAVVRREEAVAARLLLPWAQPASAQPLGLLARLLASPRPRMALLNTGKRYQGATWESPNSRVRGEKHPPFTIMTSSETMSAHTVSPAMTQHQQHQEAGRRHSRGSPAGLTETIPALNGCPGGGRGACGGHGLGMPGKAPGRGANPGCM